MRRDSKHPPAADEAPLDRRLRPPRLPLPCRPPRRPASPPSAQAVERGRGRGAVPSRSSTSRSPGRRRRSHRADAQAQAATLIRRGRLGADRPGRRLPRARRGLRRDLQGVQHRAGRGGPGNGRAGSGRQTAQGRPLRRPDGRFRRERRVSAHERRWLQRAPRRWRAPSWRTRRMRSRSTQADGFRERVAVEDEQVGEAARLDGPDLVGQAERRRGGRRRGDERLWRVRPCGSCAELERAF